MPNVHMTLQGKGGVGKTFAATMLMQYLLDRKEHVLAIDADPVTASFSAFQAFDALHFNMLDGGEIAPRMFDSFIERILEADIDVVVDNGAASFVPLSFYLRDNDVADILEDAGKQLVVHTVLTGGSAARFTASGLAELMEYLPATVAVVVWLNEFFGPVEADGKPFSDWGVYQANEQRIHGIVQVPQRTPKTYGADVREMLSAGLTFAEVEQSGVFGLMARSRLFRVRKQIFGAIETALTGL